MKTIITLALLLLSIVANAQTLKDHLNHHPYKSFYIDNSYVDFEEITPYIALFKCNEESMKFIEETLVFNDAEKLDLNLKSSAIYKMDVEDGRVMVLIIKDGDVYNIAYNFIKE